MLDENYIAIGKLNQICGLNENDDQNLFLALWPDYVRPYLLWQNVYTKVWQKFVLHNTIFHLSTAKIEFPELDARKGSFFESYLAHIVRAFSTLTAHLFMEDFILGINSITENLYGNGIYLYKSALDDYIKNLLAIENTYNISRPPPFTWRVNLPPIRFQDLLQEKEQFISQYDFRLIHKLFHDTVTIHKKSCFAFLKKYGYALPNSACLEQESESQEAAPQAVSVPTETMTTSESVYVPVVVPVVMPVVEVTAEPVKPVGIETNATDVSHAAPESAESAPDTEAVSEIPPECVAPEETDSQSDLLTQNSQVQNATPEPEKAVKEKPVIIVPQELWAGKNGEAVCAVMRDAKYSDIVIAYVLRHFVKENKTRIGKIISAYEVTDSANRRLATKLLAEAQNIVIKSA